MLAPKTDLVPVARVLKSNGTDGEAVLGLRGVSFEDLDLKEPVFIMFDGSPVPFFVESMSGRGLRKVLVRLTGIRSAEDVEEIVGADVCVEASSLPEGEGETDLSLLVGWTLYDGGTPVGKIVEFDDIPNNPCVEVDTKKGAVLIPLHEDLIESLDPDSRTIVMNVPAGLL